MPSNKPIFPTKAKMVRRANMLLVEFAIAPVIYLAATALLEVMGAGSVTNRSLVIQAFLVLVLLSLATVGMTVFVMTSKRFTSGTYRQGPLWRSSQIVLMGTILSQTQAVYGLLLTLLSGSIFYLVGFSVVAWASLLWVRGRFKQNLGKLPDAPSS